MQLRLEEVKSGDRMVVRHKGVIVADLPAKSLTDEAPVYDQACFGTSSCGGSKKLVN